MTTEQRMPVLFIGHGSPMTDDPVSVFADQVVLGSLSMQSVRIG